MATAKTESLIVRNLRVQIKTLKSLAEDSAKDCERYKNRLGEDNSLASWSDGRASAFENAAQFLEELLEEYK